MLLLSSLLLRQLAQFAIPNSGHRVTRQCCRLNKSQCSSRQRPHHHSRRAAFAASAPPPPQSFAQRAPFPICILSACLLVCLLPRSHLLTCLTTARLTQFCPRKLADYCLVCVVGSTLICSVYYRARSLSLTKLNLLPYHIIFSNHTHLYHQLSFDHH